MGGPRPERGGLYMSTQSRLFALALLFGGLAACGGDVRPRGMEDGGRTDAAADAGARCGPCLPLERCVADRCEPFAACSLEGACAASDEVCRSARCVPSSLDLDGDGTPAALDCDESAPDIHPGAAERCDGVDDDCDGTLDEGARETAWYPDSDGDGHGSGTPVVGCEAPEGYVSIDDDCADEDPDAFPGAPELCNTRDDDCDARVDEEGACPAGCRAALFGGHDDAFCVDARAFAAAQARCESVSMRLARVDSAEEASFMRSEASAAAMDRVWLGGRDDVAEGQWRWLDGDLFWSGAADGSAVGGLYTRWNSGEPNDYMGDEDCMEIFTNGLWNDQSCDTPRPSICERW